jgi:branched-subunit amino acid transport protein
VTAWIVFVLAGIGTYAIRASGVVLLREENKIPGSLRRALILVGPAAMGAIIGNTLLLDGGEWRAFGAWHIAGGIAAIVGYWRRSMGWPLLVGGAAFALLVALGA